jgi:hypothetical protein
MSSALPQSMGAESLELALKAVTAFERAHNELDKIDGGHIQATLTATLHIDGCTIGRVEMQDDFYQFVPNADWFGGDVERMGT